MKHKHVWLAWWEGASGSLVFSFWPERTRADAEKLAKGLSRDCDARYGVLKVSEEDLIVTGCAKAARKRKRG